MFSVVGRYRDDSSLEENLPKAFFFPCQCQPAPRQPAGQRGRVTGITGLRRRRGRSETM